MGRKTYESIPTKFRPLANRANIVLTTNANLQNHEDYKNAYVCHSLEDSIQKAIDLGCCSQIFVIGGAQIYDLALKHEKCKKILYTMIYNDYECDTFFPELHEDTWKCTKNSEKLVDNNNTIEFLTYDRIK